MGRSAEGDSFSDTIVEVSTSESIEAVFGVTAATDSPTEEDDFHSVITTAVLCASAAENNADLIFEVMITVVRREKSVLDVCSLPRLSTTAVAVEMTRDAVVSASCECSTSAGEAELVLTAVVLVAVPHATTGVRTVVPGNNARGGSLLTLSMSIRTKCKVVTHHTPFTCISHTDVLKMRFAQSVIVAGGSM